MLYTALYLMHSMSLYNVHFSIAIPVVSAHSSTQYLSEIIRSPPTNKLLNPITVPYRCGKVKTMEEKYAHDTGCFIIILRYDCWLQLFNILALVVVFCPCTPFLANHVMSGGYNMIMGFTTSYCKSAAWPSPS